MGDFYKIRGNLGTLGECDTFHFTLVEQAFGLRGFVLFARNFTADKQDLFFERHILVVQEDLHFFSVGVKIVLNFVLVQVKLLCQFLGKVFNKAL